MENINFNLNGRDINVSVSKKETLQSFLREKMGLTGTKRGCDSKECGACTVIIDGKARRSCATPTPNLDGTVVETIEGLSKNGHLHPIQIAFLQSGAVQCGFCTPGMR